GCEKACRTWSLSRLLRDFLEPTRSRLQTKSECRGRHVLCPRNWSF
ncbi:2474_t:CDS:1, partial [Cetraspora pellucida]